ncbi:type VI secretion system effector [Klebsiella michiganensis]|nr:type VI secretion system effector [Klebsiella michiganensis]
MAIPVYLWLKDDGGADIKGSVDVKDREGSIEVVAQEHKLYIPTDNNTGQTDRAPVFTRRSCSPKRSTLPARISTRR